MAYVLGKDWPVGEPPGIKIVHDDLKVKAPKPQNCILTSSYLDPDFLDTAAPVPTTCSSPFQSHKRFKVAMLPSTVDGVGNEGVDLVFNVQAETGTRDYQVFQKINNWTDARLSGFTIEVGFGVGAAFQKASSVVGFNAANLSISVPDAIGVDDLWAANQLATFSHGLFGKADSNFPTDGFFGRDTAGFAIDQYPVLPGIADTLTATTTLASSYADLPAGAGAAANQTAPGYVTNLPPQTGSGQLTVPANITAGDSISISLSDSDLTGSVNVTVENTQSGETEDITLTETGTGTSVFEATLPTTEADATGANNDGTLAVEGGDQVTTTYQDASNILGEAATVSKTTDVTATTPPTPAPTSGSSGGFGYAILAFLLGLVGIKALKPTVRNRMK